MIFRFLKFFVVVGLFGFLGCSAAEMDEVILTLRVKSIALDDPIIGYADIETGQPLYLPFEEFSSLLRVRVTDWDEEKGIISGWFMSKVNTFSIRYKEGVLEKDGKRHDLVDDTFIEYDNMLYALKGLWEVLFSLEIVASFDSGTLSIDSEEYLPLEEELARQQIISNFFSAQGIPKEYKYLSYPETSYAGLTLPSVSLNQSFSWNKDSKDLYSSLSVRIAADAFRLNQRVNFAYNFSPDVNKRLSNFSWTAQSESPYGNVLGVKGLRSLRLGDISSLGIPLAFQGSSGIGFQVSTHSMDYRAEGHTTSLKAYGKPGEELEFYHNGVLQEIVVIALDDEHIKQDEEGYYYEFDEIPLLPGENILKVLTYGDEGKIDEKIERVELSYAVPIRGKVFVNATVLDTGYSMFELLKGEKEEGFQHKATAVVRLVYGLGNNVRLSLLGGIFPSGQRDAQNWALSMGISTGTSKFHSSTTVSLLKNRQEDALKTAVAFYLSGRMNRILYSFQGNIFQKGYLSSSAYYNDEELQFNGFFNVSLPIGRTSLSANFRRWHYREPRRLDGAQYKESFNVSWSAYMKRLLLGATVASSRDHKQKYKDFSGRLSAGYSWWASRSISTSVRISVPYKYTEKEKKFKVDVIDFRVYVNFVRNFAVSLSPSYNTTTKKVSFTASTNFVVTGNLRTSMNVRFHENKNITISASVSTMLYHTGRGRYVASGSGGIGDGVIVPIFFIDSNRNRVKDVGEEPVEGVRVRGYSKFQQASGGDGRGVIKGVSANRIAVLSVDLGSIENPFVVPVYQRIGVAPKGGSVTEVFVPLSYVAPVEARVMVRKPDNQLVPARGMALYLVGHDGAKWRVLTDESGYLFSSEVLVGQYTIALEKGQTRYGKELSLSDDHKFEITEDSDYIELDDIVVELE